MTQPHIAPDPDVLRRAYEAAQRLAELLEMAGLPRQCEAVRQVRADVFARIRDGGR